MFPLDLSMLPLLENGRFTQLLIMLLMSIVRLILTVVFSRFLRSFQLIVLVTGKLVFCCSVVIYLV